MIEIPRTFYIYCQNELAELVCSELAVGSYLEYINDPMLELCVHFTDNSATITGSYKELVAVDTFCIGNTNAYNYKLKLFGNNLPVNLVDGVSGDISSLITVHNFNEIIFIDSFELELNGVDLLYLGHLFFGVKTCLPRFSIEPGTSIELRSESSRSFGGQAFGIRRKTLENFTVNFPWLTSEDRAIFVDYIQSVLNVEPHIIDLYPEAREQFPPRYVTLSASDISFPKLNENGFYYSSSLSWQEAR